MFDKLIDLLIQCIRLFRIYVSVPEWGRMVILRFGMFQRVAGPGLVWVLPFNIDTAHFALCCVRTMLVGPQSLVTLDGIEVVVTTLVTHTVDDPKKYVLLIESGEQVIEDTAYGVVAKFVMSKNYDDLRHEDIGKELTRVMRQKADDYGVKIKNAQTVDLTKSRSIRLIGHAAKVAEAAAGMV